MKTAKSSTQSHAYLLESILLFSTLYYIPFVIGALITIRFAFQFWNNHKHYVQQSPSQTTKNRALKDLNSVI